MVDSFFVGNTFLFHFALSGQAGKVQLTEGLVGHNGHRVCQVQAAGVGTHGDADTPIGMGLAEPLGQTGGLFSEKEKLFR